jgi:hypothetical protein
MKSHKDIAAQFKEHKSRASLLGTQYDNTRKCQAFYSGDFMDYRDTFVARGMDGQKRTTEVSFNKVKPYVNAAHGFMLQNRQRVKFASRNQDDEERALEAAYANAAHDYVRDNANADQHDARALKDMLIGGLGATETCMSYGEGYSSRDPAGEIQMMRLDPLSCAYDPAAREANLLDAQWVYYKKEYDLKTAKELFEAEDDVFEPASGDREDGEVVQSPHAGGIYPLYQRETMDFIGDPTEGRVNIYFYQWYDLEKYYRADNPLYAATTPEEAMTIQVLLESIVPAEQDDLFAYDPRAEVLTCTPEVKAQLARYFEGMEFLELTRKVYYRATLSGKHVFNASRNDSQQGFSIKFKTGDYNERKKIWTGMVNSMMEPAMFYNKALTEFMYMVAAAAKGGNFIEESAVDDIRKFEQDYGHPSKNVIVADGALSGGKIQPKRERYTPTGLENIIQESDNALPEVNGIDKSFLGSSDNRQETAALQRQRIKQVINTLIVYFDAETLYLREHARMMLDLMRVLADNGSQIMFAVSDGEGQETIVPLLPDHINAEYDVAIDDAPETATEREERANMLMQMGTALLQVSPEKGMQVYAATLDDLNLDARTKRILRDVLRPQEQQVDPAYVKKLEDMLKQVTGQAQQAQMAKLAADTQLSAARAQEAEAKVKKTEADTVKAIEESQKIGVETMKGLAVPARKNQIVV